jgi:hypothetical protein
MIIIIVSYTASGFYGHMNVTGLFGAHLWSEEAAFTREGVFNSHNSYLWTQDNPHVTREWGHQLRWSINVWAGITGNRVAGPYLLPDRLNGPAYCVFLQKCYRCCLKMRHWRFGRFDVTCGLNTMRRRRILVHRPNSTSTHRFLTGS